MTWLKFQKLKFPNACHPLPISVSVGGSAENGLWISTATVAGWFGLDEAPSDDRSMQIACLISGVCEIPGLRKPYVNLQAVHASLSHGLLCSNPGGKDLRSSRGPEIQQKSVMLLLDRSDHNH